MKATNERLRLGLILRDARLRHNLTQIAVAKAVGVSATNISLAENGRLVGHDGDVKLRADFYELSYGKIMR